MISQSHAPRLTVAAAIIVALAARAPAPTAAAVVAADDFSYPDGHLGNQDGGTGWTIPWYTASNPEGGWEVSAGRVVSGFVPFSSYCGRNYDNPATTPELFISLDFSVADLQLDDAIGIYLFIGANFTSLAFGKPPGAPDFELGAHTPTGITIVPGVTYHLIGVYDVDNARIALWVNPDASDFYNPATGENSADAVENYNPAHVGSLYIATYRPGSGQLPGVSFDNLILANTPDGVGLNSAPVLCNCLGDMNHDSIRDGRDIQRFVSCFVIGGDCVCADMNGLNGIETLDVSAFITALLADSPC